MKRQITKKAITIVVDSNIYDAIERLFGNKSKYINWLIYQDLLKNTNDEEIKKLLI
jgi:hypothetical protein